MLDFAPTASMTVIGEKLGGGPMNQSVGVLWIETRALFSQEVDLLNFVDDYTRG
jgi:hypothetical protein